MLVRKTLRCVTTALATIFLAGAAFANVPPLSKAKATNSQATKYFPGSGGLGSGAGGSVTPTGPSPYKGSLGNAAKECQACKVATPGTPATPPAPPKLKVPIQDAVKECLACKVGVPKPPGGTPPGGGTPAPGTPGTPPGGSAGMPGTPGTPGCPACPERLPVAGWAVAARR